MPGHPDPLTAAAGAGGLLDGPTSAAALSVAVEVAARVADPAQVTRAVAAAAGQTAHPASVHWRDHAVGQGHAGLALLFGAVDASLPGQGWDRTAHRHLELAARAAEGQPRLPAGLLAGIAGIGLVAACLAGDGGRYRHLLATVDQALVPQAAALAGRVDRAAGLAVRDYDLVSGLSGIAAYLLLRRSEPGPAAALRLVLQSLAGCTAEDAGGPRWRTPAGLLAGEERARFPHGYLNCGLAHGIPGPLAVLGLALQARFEVPGLPEAVDRTAAWLAAHRTRDPAGPSWPTAVPLAANRAGPVGGDRLGAAPDGAGSPGPARAAWCYGGPGVAAALRLAAEALGQQRHRQLAVAALEAALARPAGERRTDSPGFCHGQAGLLAVTAAFARASGHPGFRRAAADLTADLLDRFDPASPLGYRDLEAGGRAVDQPGLLTGAPGVALALLGATSPAEPAWARLFLLA